MAEHWLSRSQLCCFYQLFIAVDRQCREMYTRRPLLETGWEYAAHLHLKPYTLKQLFFKHTPKMSFSSCYNKWSVGYFGLKLHRHILGTPKVNIISCKKGHNRCPLIWWCHKFFLEFCTFDWLFFRRWASSTTKQAQVMEPSIAWSMVISSYDVSRTWNFIVASFCDEKLWIRNNALQCKSKFRMLFKLFGRWNM